jgi:hypothetical protein
MPLKHPVRCLSAGFNHAGSRPVAQEIRLSPSCSAASGQRHRDEGGSRDDSVRKGTGHLADSPVPGVTRRLASSPDLNCGYLITRSVRPRPARMRPVALDE